MIDWIIFIPACFLLNLSFGPNNLLALTHGMEKGVGFAQQAALGRLVAFVPMICVSALGLGLILTASATAFSILKVIGAAYLLRIGFKMIRRPFEANDQAADGKVGDYSRRIGRRNEALVALSNPKAILIFAAFFPQFIDTDAYWTSYMLVSVCFLFLELVAVSLYASVGRYVARSKAGNLFWLQRGSGLIMCGFGLILLVAPQPSR